MKDYIIHLAPRSGYEISLHSDTLFGAICWGIRMLFGEKRLVAILEEYNTTHPPFLLSSAFPCKLDGDEYQYFLPKPCLKPIPVDELQTFSEKVDIQKETYHSEKTDSIWLSNKYKRFKKIKFIGISNFKGLLTKPDEADLFADYLGNYLLEPYYCETGTAQKNSLDRLTFSTTGSGDTFYLPEIAYREKYGLYFLLKTKNIDDVIRPVLTFLEDSGIGPNARTGKNWFKVNVTEKKLFNGNNSQSGDAFIILSRYIKNEPINAADSFYRIVSVRSKVESRLEFAGEDIWKHRVSYFSAGSLISPKIKTPYYGSLAPVKTIQGKTIYQYGFAYPVWINGGGKK